MRERRTTHQLLIRDTSNGKTITRAYFLRCVKCRRNRQMRYEGGTRARCAICSHVHRVFSLFPNPQATRCLSAATEEQKAAARAEYESRLANCRKYAREAFLAQEIRHFSILEFMEAMGLPNYNDILHEVMSAPDGLKTMKTRPHTRESLWEDLAITRFHQYESPRDLTL